MDSLMLAVAFAYPSAAVAPFPPPRVTSPPLETIDEPASMRMPPWAVSSESAHRVTEPPLLCRALFTRMLAVALSNTGAVALVFTVMAAPVVMFPPVAKIETPLAPAEVIAPVPAKLCAVIETDPLAFKAPAPA